MSGQNSQSSRSRSGSLSGVSPGSDGETNSRPVDSVCESSLSDTNSQKCFSPTTLEDDLVGTARECYVNILGLIPAKTEAINKEARRKVREAATVLHEKTLQLTGVMRELRNENQRLRERVSQLELSNSSVAPHASPAFSYAKVAATPSVHPQSQTPSYVPSKKPRYAVVIKSKKPSISAQQTLTEIKSIVRPADTKVNIAAVRQTKSGAVILQCDDKEHASKIKSVLDAKGSDKFSVSEQSKKMPRMAIRLDEESKDISDLVATIARNNEFIKECCGDKFADQIKLITRYTSRGGTFAILEVSAALRLQLLNRPLYLGWSRTWARDHVNLTQCYNCFGFGHFSRDCKTKHQICGKCAGPHDLRKCPSNSIRCINCYNVRDKNPNVNYKHDPKSDSCPIRMRALAAIKNNIDYVP